jgi:hypothetical protein
MKRAWPLVVTAIVFIAFAILWIVSDRRASQRVYDRYSTENTGKEGLSLAYGYLGKTRKVGQLTRPFGREPLERNATLFRLVDRIGVVTDGEFAESDAPPPKPRLRPILDNDTEAFIRRGGRIVFAVTDGLLPADAVTVQTATKVFPIWPAVAQIKLFPTSGGYTLLHPQMHALFIAGEQVIVARQRIGAGEVYLFSAPEVLRNSQIAENLALLEALAGEGRPVYFDEVMHGIVSGDGALALMKEWNLGPFLLLLALVTALAFWREGKRVGRPDDEYRETRSDAVDLVRSLGALYRDVTPAGTEVSLYHDALVRTVAHTSGLRGEALHKRVDELTGGGRDLESINQAFRVLRT